MYIVKGYLDIYWNLKSSRTSTATFSLLLCLTIILLYCKPTHHACTADIEFYGAEKIFMKKEIK